MYRYLSFVRLLDFVSVCIIEVSNQKLLKDEELLYYHYVVSYIVSHSLDL